MKRQSLLYYLIAAGLGLAVGALSRPASGNEPARFDDSVRQDFFSGITGNREALQRAMQAAERVLSENPKHAEAMVWHGMGVYGQAPAAFQRGDIAKGRQLADLGLAEMDRAVELEPDNIGVRIPRGAALLASAREMPDSPFRKKALRRAMSDYRHSFDFRKGDLSAMGEHPKRELLFGLADAASRLGNLDEADRWFSMLASEAPETAYAKRAAQWAATRTPLPAAETHCIGCHAGK